MIEGHFRIGVGTLVSLAARGDSRAYYTFDGDLQQMGTIYVVLLNAGFPVVHQDVYPGFARDKEDEYVRALRFLFIHRVPGWWNQRRDLVAYKIIDEQEFFDALNWDLYGKKQSS